MNARLANKHWERLIIAILILDAPLCALPQVVQMCRTQSSHDVSICTWLFMFVVSLLWIWVARRDGSKILYIGSVLWAICDLAIAAVAVYFRFGG